MDLGTSIRIERPADQVFAYLAEMSNNPVWQSGMVSCEWTSEPPVGVGSTYAQEARFMGRPVRTTFRVTAYDPPRHIRIESIISDFPIQVSRTVEPDGDGCVVRAQVTGGPTGVMGLLMPLMAPLAKRSIRRDYAALKAQLETVEPADGAVDR